MQGMRNFHVFILMVLVCTDPVSAVGDVDSLVIGGRGGGDEGEKSETLEVVWWYSHTDHIYPKSVPMPLNWGRKAEDAKQIEDVFQYDEKVKQLLTTSYITTVMLVAVIAFSMAQDSFDLFQEGSEADFVRRINLQGVTADTHMVERDPRVGGKSVVQGGPALDAMLYNDPQLSQPFMCSDEQNDQGKCQKLQRIQQLKGNDITLYQTLTTRGRRTFKDLLGHEPGTMVAATEITGVNIDHSERMNDLPDVRAAHGVRSTKGLPLYDESNYPAQLRTGRASVDLEGVLGHLRMKVLRQALSPDMVVDKEDQLLARIKAEMIKQHKVALTDVGELLYYVNHGDVALSTNAATADTQAQRQFFVQGMLNLIKNLRFNSDRLQKMCSVGPQDESVAGARTKWAAPLITLAGTGNLQRCGVSGADYLQNFNIFIDMDDLLDVDDIKTLNLQMMEVNTGMTPGQQIKLAQVNTAERIDHVYNMGQNFARLQLGLLIVIWLRYDLQTIVNLLRVTNKSCEQRDLDTVSTFFNVPMPAPGCPAHGIAYFPDWLESARSDLQVFSLFPQDRVGSTVAYKCHTSKDPTPSERALLPASGDGNLRLAGRTPSCVDEGAEFTCLYRDNDMDLPQCSSSVSTTSGAKVEGVTLEYNDDGGEAYSYDGTSAYVKLSPRKTKESESSTRTPMTFERASVKFLAKMTSGSKPEDEMAGAGDFYQAATLSADNQAPNCVNATAVIPTTITDNDNKALYEAYYHCSPTEIMFTSQDYTFHSATEIKTDNECAQACNVQRLASDQEGCNSFFFNSDYKLLGQDNDIGRGCYLFDDSTNVVNTGTRSTAPLPVYHLSRGLRVIFTTDANQIAAELEIFKAHLLFRDYTVFNDAGKLTPKTSVTKIISTENENVGTDVSLDCNDKNIFEDHFQEYRWLDVEVRKTSNDLTTITEWHKENDDGFNTVTSCALASEHSPCDDSPVVVITTTRNLADGPTDLKSDEEETGESLEDLLRRREYYRYINSNRMKPAGGSYTGDAIFTALDGKQYDAYDSKKNDDGTPCIGTACGTLNYEASFRISNIKALPGATKIARVDFGCVTEHGQNVVVRDVCMRNNGAEEAFLYPSIHKVRPYPVAFDDSVEVPDLSATVAATATSNLMAYSGIAKDAVELARDEEAEKVIEGLRFEDEKAAIDASFKMADRSNAESISDTGDDVEQTKTDDVAAFYELETAMSGGDGRGGSSASSGSNPLVEAALVPLKLYGPTINDWFTGIKTTTTGADADGVRAGITSSGGRVTDTQQHLAAQGVESLSQVGTLTDGAGDMTEPAAKNTNGAGGWLMRTLSKTGLLGLESAVEENLGVRLYQDLAPSERLMQGSGGTSFLQLNSPLSSRTSDQVRLLGPIKGGIQICAMHMLILVVLLSARLQTFRDSDTDAIFGTPSIDVVRVNFGWIPLVQTFVLILLIILTIFQYIMLVIGSLTTAHAVATTWFP